MKSRITDSDLKTASFINKERIAEDIGNTIVLAPHPDDESLGCGGLIAMLTNAGKEVSVIFITNGSASHLHSKEYPPHKLGQLRIVEAIQACNKLGVRTNNIYFLNAPDGGLATLDQSEIDQLIETIKVIIESKEFQTILLPWRRDPHPDHVATNRIGQDILETYADEIISLEYPIWLWKNGKQHDWPLEDEVHPIRLDISDFVSIKESAIQKHQSQLGRIIKDDPSGFVLTEDLLKPFRGKFEYYFTDVDRKLNTLDKSYFNKIYQNSKDPWNFKESDYEKCKYKKSLAALGNSHFHNGLEIGCSIGVQTRMLSEICENLLAIDISEIAIEEAKKNNADKDNIEFEVMNVANDFPQEKFDLITLCEVGYYFDKMDLAKVFNNIHDSLMDGGTLLVVHWVGFVPEYPISGDDVHNGLQVFLENKSYYKRTINQRTERYRLEVWRKVAN